MDIIKRITVGVNLESGFLIFDTEKQSGKIEKINEEEKVLASGNKVTVYRMYNISGHLLHELFWNNTILIDYGKD